MLSTPMGRTFMKRAAQIFRDERAEGSAVAVETLKGRKLQFVAHLIHRFAWILRSEPWGEWTRNLLNYRGDCRLVYDEEDLLFDGTSYRKFAYYIGCEDIVTTKGAGHLAIKTCPELIAKHIKDFLENRRAA